MSEIKCWFLLSALQGSRLHTRHLTFAFWNNQKEVQSCRVMNLKLLLIRCLPFLCNICFL